MRCRECDYPLWNLHARVCPECGLPFSVGDQVFRPSAVQFHCPDCDQVYFGTDARGHLEPAEFDCITCGRHLHLEETVLRPRAGVAEEHTRPEGMPWLDRREGRWIRAWLSTIGLALVRPAALMRAVPVESSLRAAWWFAVLTNVAMLVVRLLPALCLLLPLLAVRGRAGGPSAGLLAAVLGGSTVGMIVITVLVVVVSLGLWTMVCHGVLRATGATAGGLRRTLQAICYSSGANASSAVPCLGDVGWIWWVVSAILMVRVGQRVSGWRASGAVLAYPVVIVLAGLAVFVAATGATVAMTPPAPTASASERFETRTLGRRLVTYARANGGRGPAHALALVPAGAGVGSFVSASGRTSPDAVAVAGTTLAAVQAMGPGRQSEVAARAASALPADVVAYRLGDFVFTDRGLDYTNAPSGVWLVVLCVDPDLNPDAAADNLHAARLDGGVERISPDRVARRLERQNAIRRAAGLVDLPDPRGVR